MFEGTWMRHQKSCSGVSKVMFEGWWMGIKSHVRGILFLYEIPFGTSTMEGDYLFPDSFDGLTMFHKDIFIQITLNYKI